MHERPGPSFSAQVISGTAWYAGNGIPGRADLYRDPLKTPRERLHAERRGPSRLEKDGAVAAAA